VLLVPKSTPIETACGSLDMLGLALEKGATPLAVAVVVDKMGVRADALSEQPMAAIELSETVQEPEPRTVVAEGRSSRLAR